MFHEAYGTSINGLLITKAQYEAKWPFRLDSLYLFRGEKSDVYVERKDTIYAVNSIASDKADSGEFGSFQQWHLIVKNPTIDQIKAKNEIERLGLEQWVNFLNRY
ncbi:hypothetical protein KB206_04130 [Microvirga sp. STS02]|nr:MULTISPECIES: DUF2511 domain-containing protein [Bacteria]MBR7207793.1 hypothetical protein [Microvirga sp. STS02]